jgi:hypothetical protein
MHVRIILRLRDQGAAALRALALRRTRFALRRVVGIAPEAEVTLSEGGEGDPGADKQCEVRLASPATGAVVARSLGSDWRAVVDRALARAVRRLVAACRRAWQIGSEPRALAWQPARLPGRR